MIGHSELSAQGKLSPYNLGYVETFTLGADQFRDGEPVPEAEPAVLGAKAYTCATVLDTLESSSTDSERDRPNEEAISNPEGNANAERYKAAHDAVIMAIESAAQNRDESLDVVLSAIDALATTSYVSSVPEFINMVGSARSAIEMANGISDEALRGWALGSAQANIDATLTAYRP